MLTVGLIGLRYLSTGGTQCKHSAHCTDTGGGETSEKAGGTRPAKAARIEVKPAPKPKGPTSAQRYIIIQHSLLASW